MRAAINYGELKKKQKIELLESLLGYCYRSAGMFTDSSEDYILIDDEEECWTVLFPHDTKVYTFETFMEILRA